MLSNVEIFYSFSDKRLLNNFEMSLNEVYKIGLVKQQRSFYAKISIMARTRACDLIIKKLTNHN